MTTSWKQLVVLTLCLIGAAESAADAGWFEDATGMRTPDSIRKIAPNGIQVGQGRHNPPSYVTPDSVFNGPPPATTPKSQPQSNGWTEMERVRREQERMQQLQWQAQQQAARNAQQAAQLQYQLRAAQAQQTGQLINSILQGIGPMIDGDSSSRYSSGGYGRSDRGRYQGGMGNQRGYYNGW